MNKFYLGIDPGKTGAACLLNSRGELAGQVTDWAGLFNFVQTLQKNGARLTVGLEHVHAAPGQGVVSVFTFGEGFGYIRGVLEASGLQYQLISPQAWQKILPWEETGQPKERVKKYAAEKWGLEKFIQARCRVPHQGLLDAACLAEYLRKVEAGEAKPPVHRPKKKKRLRVLELE